MYEKNKELRQLVKELEDKVDILKHCLTFRNTV